MPRKQLAMTMGRAHFLFCIFISIILSVCLLSGCSSESSQTSSDQSANVSGQSGDSSGTDDNASGQLTDSQSEQQAASNESLRDSTPQVLTTESTGTVTYGNDTILLDASNISQGYVVLVYSGSNEKVKFQVAAPDGTTCTYLVTGRGTPLAYPLTGGDGAYTVTLLESVDAANDKYAISFTQSLDVSLENEFLPFLYPNVYVDFTADTKAVAKGEELAENCSTDLDVINNVYHFVTETITYDEEKAQNVSYGYTPDVDDTLAQKKGICFDYASLMTTMLRTQRIPTKLEVGYVGDIYHAWISCYVDEIGWVDNIIEFDGKNWSLMDPTLAAGKSSTSVQQYIGDGSKYVVKYTY